ncbi:hypothetical protein [Undibacterium squillarum]|uniref:WGR domain-containing protein n=1 Tax=Undibacterium squillarum TaxID=1131567 RepID=A0ABQ2XW15_9BURK|nr:hypothetical protein [Undibacterium squillarum]GGX35332.1 hypothetical protein GCM10010946_10920 [Undibacterium squillarum]
MAGIVKKYRLMFLNEPSRLLEIELIRAPGHEEPARYLVNWREGKSGKAWQEHTRTPFPVSLAEAEQLCDDLYRSRLQQGYALKDLRWPEDLPVKPAPAPDLTQTAVTTVTKNAALPDIITPQQQALLQQLDRWRSLSPRARSRLAWQLGEHRCRAALPALIPYLQSGSDLLDYCICYAIVRCEDPGAYPAVQALLTRTSSPMTGRIARLAWLVLCPASEAQDYAEKLVQSWPQELQQAWQTGLQTQDAEPVLKSLLHAMRWEKWRLDDWLESLYLISFSAEPAAATLARTLVLSQCRSLPVDSLVFRAMRHLWKIAEIRLDAELYGLLLMRFEVTAPRVFNASSAAYIYLPRHRRPVPYRQAVQQEENQLCFSNLTRDYFRRRGWRTLRRLAVMQPDAYPAMASGVLLAAREQDAAKAFVSRHPYWDSDTRQYKYTSRHHSSYSRWLVLSQILFREDAGVCWSSSGLSWWRTEPEQQYAFKDQPRTEAFAALWNAQPAHLLQCLLQSDIATVQRFAARALHDLPAFLAELSADQWQQILLQGESGLALAWAYHQPLLESGTAAPDCAIWFLQAGYAPATEFILRWLTAHPEVTQQCPAILLHLVLHPDQRCQHLLQLLMPRLQAAENSALLDAVNTWLSGNPDISAEARDRACSWVQDWLSTAAANAGIAQAAVWERVLQEGHPRLKRIALLLISHHPQWQAESCIRQLPEWMADADPDLRILAATLCTVLPPAIIFARPDLISFLACTEHARVRLAIWPLLYRLETGSSVIPQLARTLIDALFRALPDDAEPDSSANPGHHLHQEILRWMQHYQSDVLPALDTDLQWRLLQARSGGAQLAGFWLLETEDSGFAVAMTPARWIALARHPMAAVRLHMLQHFQRLALHDLTERAQWLDAFHTPWPEFRAALMTCWEQQLRPGDWTLSELMHCCDHPYDDIQRFARQLLTERFRAEEAAQWLADLSQHPSESMQLFVSQWLEQVFQLTPVPEKAALLNKLLPYFLNVLSRVNRSRVTRLRSQHLLHGLAKQQADLAHLVIPLYVRLVATQAVQDKASYILGLTEILQIHPQLATLAEGIVSMPPAEIRSHRRGEKV